MAIHRGIQSAIFYYLSCAPCAEARYRKKRKQEAAWDRKARADLAAELPYAYQHPSPSSTNPHWQTEIAMGPTGVSRGKRKTNTTSEPQRGIKKTPTGFNSQASASLSEVDIPSHGNEKDGDRWNYRPYQRDDEELWGSMNNLDGMLHDTSGLQMPQRARTKDSTNSTIYQPTRNPPISDLHPATVTKVSSREEVMWMMQPPPVAEVMSGKERASRSRSDSGGSRLTPTMSAVYLSRQLSNRLIERRMRAETSATAMSRESSSRTSTPAAYQNHGQGQSFPATSERDSALSPGSSIRDLPFRDSSEDSHQTVIHNQDARKPQPHRTASRPQLSTITSSAEFPTTERPYTPTDLPDLVKENSHPSPPQSRDSDAANMNGGLTRLTLPHRHSASFVVKTGKELHLLRREEISSPQPHSSRPGTSSQQHGSEAEVDDANVDDLLENMDEEEILTTLETNPKAAAELFNSWYTPDFELGTWVLEHTKREGVRERWSMEF